MDRNLRTGRRDGRYAGDFAWFFIFNEIYPTTNEPAGTNRPGYRSGDDTVTEFNDGVDAINLRAVTDITGCED